MSDSRSPASLTFHWRDRDRPLGRLILLLTLTAGGVVSLFFVFQVVYPQTRVFNASPHQVLLLDPAQPTSRDLVNRARDEVFLFSNPGAGAAGAAATLSSGLPVFRPSFAGYEMALQDIPEDRQAGTFPRLFTIQNIPLPHTATILKAGSPTPAPAPVPKQVLKATLQGGLAGRALESQPDLSGIALQEPYATRYVVAVSDVGAVVFALPIEPIPDRQLSDNLRRAVTALRFKPAPGSPVQWGEVSFHWETVPK